MTDPIEPRRDRDAPEPRMPEPKAAPADRSISPIAGRLGGPRSRWITLAALTAGCGAFLFATWDQGDRRDRPAPDEPARQFVPFEPGARPTRCCPINMKTPTPRR